MRGIEQIPRTALEVFKMLPEGTACEVIDNVLYMSPAPTFIHQRSLLKIAGFLDLFVTQNQLGIVVSPPFDVYLDEERNAVQPDILFIKEERNNIIHKNGIHGSPDLIVELLSSNRTHDTQLKYSLYEEKGVKEYIIVDPETREVWQYVLENGHYKESGPTEKGKIHINLLNLDIEF